jgi:hypothetical protein
MPGSARLPPVHNLGILNCSHVDCLPLVVPALWITAMRLAFAHLPLVDAT